MADKLMEYLNIGKLGRSFGLNHQIRISFLSGMETIWENTLQQGSAVFVGIADFKIPFLIDQFNEDKQLIKFKKVRSEAEVKELMGQQLYVELTDDVDAQYFDTQVFQQLTIIDFQSKETIGLIDRIEEFPSQTMAIVIRNNQEIMIPLVEEWVKEIDAEGQAVYMELPDGLVE